MKLNITKTEEAQVLARVLNIGADSLNPDDYDCLVGLCETLSVTRGISAHEIAVEHVHLTQEGAHFSDCGIHNAPASLPLPCSCYPEKA